MIAFRLVQTDDIAILAEIFSDRSYASTRDLIFRAENSMARELGLGVVVLLDNEIIGFGMATLWSQVAEISDLVIRHDKRRQGFGTQLIHHLINYAAQHRNILEIGVRDDNSQAQTLYERLGFVYQRTIQLHFSSEPHDIYYLQKQV